MPGLVLPYTRNALPIEIYLIKPSGAGSSWPSSPRRIRGAPKQHNIFESQRHLWQVKVGLLEVYGLHVRVIE